MSYQGAFLHICSDNESMLDSKEGWTLAARRKPHKKKVSHTPPTFLGVNDISEASINIQGRKEKNGLKENKW